MKPLIAAVLLSLNVPFCFSQKESEIPYSPTFVAGISVYELFSSSNDVRRYNLKSFQDGEYTSVANNYNSSALFRVEGEFQYEYLYVQGGLSIRNETTNLEAHNLEEYYHFAFTQSYNAEVRREIYINEKQTSLIVSAEVGSYFLKKDRPFRIGMGVGLDFCLFFDSKNTGANELNLEETRIHPDFPEIYSTTTSSHTKGSPDWNKVVWNVQMPLVVPKISLITSYRFFNHFSLSAQTELRFLSLKPSTGIRKMVLEFPVGMGLRYHF